MRPSKAGLLFGVIVVSGSFLSPSLTRAQTIRSAGQTNWTQMTHADCVRRADKAINAAGKNFGLPLSAGLYDGWLVTSRLADTTVDISCIADADNNRFVDTSTRRVLVDIKVHTLRGSEAHLRDFLRDCFYQDRCGPTIASGTGTGAGADSDDSGPLDGRLSETRCTWRAPKKNQGISSNNTKKIDKKDNGQPVTVDYCKNKCLADPENKTWCKSMEYVTGTNEYCYLSKVKAGQGGFSLQHFSGMNYYDFKCALVESAGAVPASGSIIEAAGVAPAIGRLNCDQLKEKLVKFDQSIARKRENIKGKEDMVKTMVGLGAMFARDYSNCIQEFLRDPSDCAGIQVNMNEANANAEEFKQDVRATKRELTSLLSGRNNTIVSMEANGCGQQAGLFPGTSSSTQGATDHDNGARRQYGYTAHPGKAISGRNILKEYKVTLPRCRDLCDSHEKCLSFEFNSDNGECAINKTATGAGTPGGGWTWYVKNR